MLEGIYRFCQSPTNGVLGYLVNTTIFDTTIFFKQVFVGQQWGWNNKLHCCPLVQNNHKFLVNLFFCLLTNFLTKIRQIFRYLKLSKIRFLILLDFPGMFVPQFQIITMFSHICQSVCLCTLPYWTGYFCFKTSLEFVYTVVSHNKNKDSFVSLE